MKTTPFLKISEAAKVTGLSQYYLRKGVKDGSVPHVKSGTVYYVNIVALQRRLEEESLGQVGAVAPSPERGGQ